MSDVTLEQLYNGFLLNREIFLSGHLRKLEEHVAWQGDELAQNRRHFESITIEKWADNVVDYDYVDDSPIVHAVRAAQRYLIALEFNEFEPQKADMLWKLQNGGAV